MVEMEEKTEAPTPRRREEARQRGQFARSEDLAAAGVLLSAMLLLQSAGPKLLAAWKVMVADALSSPMTGLNVQPLTQVMRAVMPLLLALIAVAAVIVFVQAGFAVRVRLKFHPIDPSRGWDRVFSRRSAARLAIHTIKIVTIGWIAWSAGGKWMERIVSLQELSPTEGLAAGASTVFAVGIRIAIALLVLAMIDYALEWRRNERELRMTRREVKDELRQMEGHPGIKHHRREVALEELD